MFEKIDKVVIGNHKMPIRCDIAVLGALQEEFGTLTSFEQQLIGMQPILNEDGSYKYKEDGSIEYKFTEPSYKAIAYSLPLFILEGIDQAELQGENYDGIDWRTPLKDADFDYIQIALAINSEFQRCFHRKKKTNLKGTQKQTQTK